MTNDNLKKWELKLIASERRVLAAHLVAEANDLALMDDHMRVGCFKRTGLLIEYTKSKFDDDIKLQGVVSKIVVSNSHEIINNNLNNAYLSPTESVIPESQHDAIKDSDIY